MKINIGKQTQISVLDYPVVLKRSYSVKPKKSGHSKNTIQSEHAAYLHIAHNYGAYLKCKIDLDAEPIRTSNSVIFATPTAVPNGNEFIEFTETSSIFIDQVIHWYDEMRKHFKPVYPWKYLGDAEEVINDHCNGEFTHEELIDELLNNSHPIQTSIDHDDIDLFARKYSSIDTYYLDTCQSIMMKINHREGYAPQIEWIGNTEYRDGRRVLTSGAMADLAIHNVL